MKSVMIILIAFVLLIPLSVSVLSGSTTEYGSLNVSPDTVAVLESELTILQISGTVLDYNSGQMILIKIITPDNTSTEIKTQANNDGIFSTPLILDSNWIKGDYQLLATHLNNEIGSVTFSITSVSIPNITIFANIGSLEIDNQEITVSGNERSTVEISGNIQNYQRGEPITLKITHPDELLSDVVITGQSNGDFKAHISIEENWKSGSFNVIASYDEKDFGQVDFHLNKIQIPKFFKNVASWWSDGLIEDSEFVKGIEFLINEGIIEIPNLSKSIENNEGVIPEWVRQNIGWWANGLTSNTELVNSLQYLVEKGIIQVN